MTTQTLEAPVFARTRALVQLIMSYAFDHVEKVNSYARSLNGGKIVMECRDEDFEEVTKTEIEAATAGEMDSLWRDLICLVDVAEAEVG